MTASQSTLAEALNQAIGQLAKRTDCEPRIEAEVLLCFALGKPRSHLAAWPDKILTREQQQRFAELLSRRLEGEPVAYITGQREFWSLNLDVTPATLIPRPETELLVERALELIPLDTTWTIADLGTGSGAIALALASERPNSRILAVEQSPQALEVATRNTKNCGIVNVEFLAGSWCDAFPPGTRLDLILSNPPYVAEGDPHLERGDLPWEPSTALTSGTDGLNDIRLIAAQAHSHLKTGGGLLLEHGLDQGESVRNILKENGFHKTQTLQDLERRERVTEGFRA
ncbi:peptide chain release factor N(5)-glutamine methyltransferase [Solemya velesiana gill symbiont]|uniref:Release factor glutamine methyltransferase n=1 Tax=Solemya velesiana gill symbiont TaxID=1918948 RepID=A0A1T2KYE3_9GAMM|nr:peptide chain release factor N(5)-glutamine methyltransferase [Solemya velesiana gill symbiont]OOZ37780.1 protein-(glutamine-N5) methyltransferase, release factor-specific [Solemya velesiana gill symbiont]